MERPKILAIIGTALIIGAFWGLAQITPPTIKNGMNEYSYFDQVDESRLSISGVDDLKRLIPRSFIRALSIFKKKTKEAQKLQPSKEEIVARTLLAVKTAQLKAKGGKLTSPARFEYRKTKSKSIPTIVSKSNRFNSNPSFGSQGITGSTIGGNAVAKTAPGSNKEGVDPSLLTAAEWFDLLNSEPNPKKLNEFLTLSLQGKISGDVYYRVVQLLADSKETHSRKYAAQILTSIPNAKNFLGLVELERKYDSDSASLKSVYSAYNVYSRSLVYVGPLMNVIESSDDILALVTALKLLSDSAKRSILSQGPTASGEQPTGFSDITTQQTFTQVLEMAQQLSTQARDLRVKDRAVELADTLSKYISSTGVAAAEMAGR